MLHCHSLVRNSWELEAHIMWIDFKRKKIKIEISGVHKFLICIICLFFRLKLFWRERDLLSCFSTCLHKSLTFTFASNVEQLWETTLTYCWRRDSIWRYFLLILILILHDKQVYFVDFQYFTRIIAYTTNFIQKKLWYSRWWDREDGGGVLNFD